MREITLREVYNSQYWRKAGAAWPNIMKFGVRGEVAVVIVHAQVFSQSSSRVTELRYPEIGICHRHTASLFQWPVLTV